MAKSKEFKAEYLKEYVEPELEIVKVPGINDPFLTGLNVKIEAKDIPFDPSTSGLTSTNVQDAIVETFNAIGP